ncbi:hypothetical protein PHSC3_001378 [Chlamydiales bacterium STE3]|nr:hypothetical protein PHSC3_001378 [Chlamydiales bacterium STE3]
MSYTHSQDFENDLEAKIIKIDRIILFEGIKTGLFLGLGIVLLPLLPVFGPISIVKVVKTIKKTCKIQDRVDKTNLGISAIKEIFENHPLLDKEAHLIRECFPTSKHFPTSLTNEKMKTLAAIAKNMCAFNVSFKKAEEMLETESLLSNKFSPARILDLLNYEESIGIKFAKETRREILKHMSSVDADGSLPSAAEARIRTYIAWRKQEEAYKDYSDKDIERIFRYFVNHSPNISFEQACKEVLNSMTKKVEV